MALATLSPFPSTRPFFPRNPNPKPLIRTQRGARYADQAPSKAVSLVPRRTPTEPATTTFLSSGRSGRSAAAIQAAQISGETVRSNAEKWSKTAMLVIDMQNDFSLPEGLICVAGGQAIVPSLIQAISVARERGIFVIWGFKHQIVLGRLSLMQYPWITSLLLSLSMQQLLLLLKFILPTSETWKTLG